MQDYATSWIFRFHLSWLPGLEFLKWFICANKPFGLLPYIHYSIKPFYSQKFDWTISKFGKGVFLVRSWSHGGQVGNRALKKRFNLSIHFMQIFRCV